MAVPYLLAPARHPDFPRHRACHAKDHDPRAATAYCAATGSPLVGERLSIGTNVKMLAATGVLDSGPLSVEAGPAVFRLRTDDGGEWESKDATATRIGALAGVRLAIPFKGFRIFASAQYRLVGSTRGGPYTTPSGSVPLTKINFNHAYLGLGLARRF